MRVAEARHFLDDRPPVICVYADECMSLEDAQTFASAVMDTVRAAKADEAKWRDRVKSIIGEEGSE